MENWKYHATYSGTPQGGILSPILANIYLHELDLKIEELKKEYDKPAQRTKMYEYKAKEWEIYKVRHKINETTDTDEKTRITYSSECAGFLGYDVRIRRSSQLKKRSDGIIQRTLNQIVEITDSYNAQTRGICNYYSMASNYSKLSYFVYLMEYSCLKTLVVCKKCHYKIHGRTFNA